MSFYNWSLNNGYKDNLSIDRINNNLGYSPDNCRWATQEIQSRNTRRIRENNSSEDSSITILTSEEVEVNEHKQRAPKPSKKK